MKESARYVKIVEWSAGIPANVLHRCVWRVGPVTTGGHATERQASPSQHRAMSLNGYLSPEAPPRRTLRPRRGPL